MKRLLLTTLAILSFAVAQAQEGSSFYHATILRICDYDGHGNIQGCKDFNDDTQIEITDDLHYVRRHVTAGKVLSYQTYDVKHDEGEPTFIFKTRSLTTNGRFTFVINFDDKTFAMFDDDDDYTAYLYYWSKMIKQ